MSSAKTLLKRAALFAVETGGYGSGSPALAPATDGFQTYEDFEPKLGYLFDGTRDGTAAGTSTGLSRVGASGRKIELDLVHYFKGGGGAYSASVRATIDRILRAIGMVATVTATPGSEKVDYAPTSDPTQWTSLVGELYRMGQKYTMKGAYVSKIVIESKGYAVPKITISLIGIATGLPVDVSPIIPAALVYPGATLQNPRAVNLGLSFTNGGQTFASGRPADWTLTLEREVTERTNQNDANGDHGGLCLGGFKGTLDFTLEATALVTASPYISSTALDPYRLYETGAQVAWALNVGGTQYNRLKASANYAQFTAPPGEQGNGPVALWGGSLACFAQDDTKDNSLLLTTD